MKRVFTTLLFLGLLISGQSFAQTKVQREPRSGVVATPWTYTAKADKVENVTQKIWMVHGGVHAFAIVDCKRANALVVTSVLDSSNDSIYVRFRTLDMLESDATITTANFHSIEWTLSEATSLFWRGKPSVANEVFMTVPKYPEGFLTLHFVLPPIPEECR